MIKTRGENTHCFRSIIAYSGKGLRIVFFLSILVLLLSSSIRARTIWKIGLDNDNASEFGLPGWDPNLDQDIIEYPAPQNWDDADWKSFPAYLWPLEVQFSPKEIHIIYDYPREYRCPRLRIKAKSAVKNFTQMLIVEKKDDPNAPIGMAELPSQFALFEFPMEYVRKGIHEKNKIIIKNHSVTDNHSIYFDYLELDDQDKDGDGSLDSEEIEGDIDGDGIENGQDPDTATLFIQSRDELIKKWITLDIQEQEGLHPYFTWLNLMDTNSPGLPPGLPEGIFFPFGFFNANIKIPIDEDRFILQVIYPEDDMIYQAAQFYLHKGIDGWQRIPLEIVAQNTVRLSIDTNKESGYSESRYSKEDREVTIIGGLAYPEGIGIVLDKTECFISSLNFNSL